VAVGLSALASIDRRVVSSRSDLSNGCSCSFHHFDESHAFTPSTCLIEESAVGPRGRPLTRGDTAGQSLSMHRVPWRSGTDAYRHGRNRQKGEPHRESATSRTKRSQEGATWKPSRHRKAFANDRANTAALHQSSQKIAQGNRDAKATRPLQGLSGRPGTLAQSPSICLSALTEELVIASRSTAASSGNRPRGRGQRPEPELRHGASPWPAQMNSSAWGQIFVAKRRRIDGIE